MELVSYDPATGRIVIAMRRGEFADIFGITTAAYQQYDLFDPEILHKTRDDVKWISDETCRIICDINDKYPADRPAG